MGNVSEEDKDGFINLNVKVHRSDIIDALGIGVDEDAELTEEEKKTVALLDNKEFFKRVAQCMADNEPFSGGDDYSDSCREAYEAETEGV